MKRIEAKTLEEAYAKAARELGCSVSELDYEIVQHPSKGFLGIGAKNAVIVALCRSAEPSEKPVSQPTETVSTAPDTREKQAEKSVAAEEKVSHETPPSKAENERPAQEAVSSRDSEESILENFFDEKEAESPEAEEKRPAPETREPLSEPDSELGPKIEAELKELIATTCFDIDTVEVDVIDGTAYVFIDGEDAALLIGKEGYRYNALSYLLYNWLHNTYGLYVKLEIAQFLASQQEMIRHYLQPVVEHVRQEGWGKTRPLDGILVQIALEQLREEFPDKYVAIKRTRNGERYVLVAQFNKRT
jgi:spoIIIJ-associated protein